MMTSKRKILALCAGAIAAGTTYATCTSEVAQQKANATQLVIEAVREQEQRLGMKHEGLPVVKINSRPVQAFFDRMLRREVGLGYYHPVGDSISIYSNFVAPTKQPADSTPSKNPKLAELIRHEIGHRTVTERARQLGAKNLPHLSRENQAAIVEWKRFSALKDINPAEHAKQLDYVWGEIGSYVSEGYAKHMLSEGTAVYLQTRGAQRDILTDDCIPKNPKTALIKGGIAVRYDCGYHFVKPILDAHGLKGLDWLLKNEYEERTLEGIARHRDRALRELEQKTK